MKKELETNVNVKEERDYRKLDSYEEYKQHGNQGTRRIAKENSFKTKIRIIINQSKKENKWLYHSLNIMFGVCHVKAHEKWLIRNMENDSNIYRTYNNIQKSVERSLIEILPIPNFNRANIFSGLKRKWKAGIGISQQRNIHLKLFLHFGKRPGFNYYALLLLSV